MLISSHELEALEKLTNHVAIMARGRIAAVGTLPQIRDLLDDYPLSIRIDVDRVRDMARLLLAVPEVLAIDVDAKGDSSRLIVKARNPSASSRPSADWSLKNRSSPPREPLDDSAHAILGYLLGGSGRT